VTDVLQIDGSRHSGSGTIVRQSVALAAVTGRPIEIINARVRRDKPGLRRQHIRVVQAIAELVDGETDGLSEGSQRLLFRPGRRRDGGRYQWDIGSAGSVTMLALGVLPVLATRTTPSTVEIRGGLFQDFAPSLFHFQHVLLPLLERMGLHARVEMIRPGYVPRGDGIVRLDVDPIAASLRPLLVDKRGAVERVWGVALASHLAERRVAHRMAEAARAILAHRGYQPDIELIDDTSAVQAGAALALFADTVRGARLGADQAGALGRPAERIGQQVAWQLLEEIDAGTALDRFASDQIIPFAAMANGESRLTIPYESDHIRSHAWLVSLFFGTQVITVGQTLTVKGSSAYVC
jgi:RNA 3'-terminal phosphate cyclase (ATP)